MLLREVVEAVGVPVAGVISDGQHSIRKAVATALPEVPHQLCHFHFLREAREFATIEASLGGPAGLTAYARSIDDEVTRLDRNEPTLNEARPGDPRDTTTPDVMAADLEAVVLGSRLSAGSRAQLTAWLVANTTGGTRLRAGLPKDWRVGDKTGTGSGGTNNDVAVVWPPGRAPLVVCAYITETQSPSEHCNAAIASAARAVAASLT